MRAHDVLADDANEVELDGTKVRKGSVGAFLANARALGDSATGVNERRQVLRDIEELVPSLRALGLFDVLEIRNEELRAFVAAVR